jgi:6-phosphogluconolactonase
VVSQSLTCSFTFPENPLPKENQKWVSHIKLSPETPPENYFTFPVINSYSYIALAVCNASKAGAVQTAWGNSQNSIVLPVQMFNLKGN